MRMNEQLKNLSRSIFILIVSVTLFSCGGGNLPKIGEETSVKKECLSAVDEESFDELNKVCNRKDEKRLIQMMNSGKVYVIKSYETGIMKDKTFLKCLVEFDRTGEVWIDNEFIQEK